MKTSWQDDTMRLPSCTHGSHSNGVVGCCNRFRVDSRFAPSQWETALLCNDVSHWLGANLESTLVRWFFLIFYSTILYAIPQWRYDMETLSPLLALCEGNTLVTSDPHKGQVMRSFHVLFAVGLINLLNISGITVTTMDCQGLKGRFIESQTIFNE